MEYEHLLSFEFCVECNRRHYESPSIFFNPDRLKGSMSLVKEFSHPSVGLGGKFCTHSQPVAKGSQPLCACLTFCE